MISQLMQSRLAFGVILLLLPIEPASEYMFVCLSHYIQPCCIAGIEGFWYHFYSSVCPWYPGMLFMQCKRFDS